VGGKAFVGSVIAVAARSIGLWLVTSLCLTGCARQLSPTQSASPQANSMASPLAQFGDVLNSGRLSDANPGINAGGAGRSDANTQPMIYYGDSSTRQPIAAGETRRTGGESRSAIVPVAYVVTGVGPADNDKFQVTFENADINAVVRAILGDSLKENYLIDPRVHGTISLSAQRPISRSQMILLLESALRTMGAVLVHQEGVYRILPASDASGVGGANIGPDAGTPGFGITALPLQNISAEALGKILDGFGATPGTVHIDAARNLLLVRGTTSERQWLIDTALAFDVDWMRNQSIGIFPIKTSSPEIIINELNQMADASTVKFQPISRMNAVLAVAKGPETIRQIQTWVARLDRDNDYGASVHVYRLKSADARKVVAVLKEVFGAGMGPSAAGMEQTAPAGGPPITARTPPGGPGPTPPSETNRQAVGIGEASEATAAAKVRITADVASNSVVVYANQQDYKPIKFAIIELDRPTPEVAIEAIAAEVTLNDNLNYGVQFFLQNNLTNGTPTAIAQLSAAAPIAQTIPGLNLVLGSIGNPNVVINALRDVTDVKVLSSPSLVVADNQPAILQVGDQVPVTTGTATSTITTQSAIVNSVSYVDTGVILRVTPHISRTATVRLDIEQEVSAVEQNSNATTLTPTISQQKVKSTVDVDNGQTVLLAGLISDQHSSEKSGIPGVVDIPLLGNVLSNSTNTGKRTELIVFVKPQIVRNNGDAQRVAQELRRRMPGFNNW